MRRGCAPSGRGIGRLQPEGTGRTGPDRGIRIELPAVEAYGEGALAPGLIADQWGATPAVVVEGWRALRAPRPDRISGSWGVLLPVV